MAQSSSSGIREHPWSRLDSDNLTSLQELTEKALLSATKHRYSCNQIYTDVGDILVAVNPFQDLPLYGEEWSKAYSRPDVSGLAPHIYRVAARAFNAMVQGKKDQVCVISGESGAGKTESAKFIMYQVSVYLCYRYHEDE
jgi:myosin heavy subunit